jgi:PhnB protein
MKLYVYLNYGGNCEEAFRFYEQHLGATMTEISRHGDVPNLDLAENWKDKVLHARIDVGDTVVMGADIPGERFQPMRSAYLSLMCDSDNEADRIYSILSEGGEIFMKMESTFFASRFAMLRDRFGTSWMLLHEHPAG